ncbi:CopG family antitoxin [Moorella sp. Hama-1]|uniref:CopG family antitoxin n=1 Tax=Moorella sp. Hama-1 TaxID=2138101 RepID=UPI000D65BF87|nr:CopG family antitoxin [Moorella sp. Hama-1]BCV20417.1 hypothetical protein hamaS1_04860 [Moorella sp. Hama-1]
MKKKIPVFKSEEEEARFWDKEDTTEYLGEFEPVECQVTPELEQEIIQKKELKKPITLRLEPSQIEAVKRIAVRKGLPYQSLIRMWIVEGIQRSKARS